jgi:hypothetical protein
MSLADAADLPLAEAEVPLVQEARLWMNELWTARVVKNLDDDGWAVEMIRRGHDEPALVGPWTMGRDKRNPKPLDAAAFHTLVKTAGEVLRRHEQQREAQLHRRVDITLREASIRVTLDIVPDEEHPYGTLAAHDAEGNELIAVRVPANFRLTANSALAWAESDFRRPD